MAHPTLIDHESVWEKLLTGWTYTFALFACVWLVLDVVVDGFQSWMTMSTAQYVFVAKALLSALLVVLILIGLNLAMKVRKLKQTKNGQRRQ